MMRGSDDEDEDEDDSGAGSIPGFVLLVFGAGSGNEVPLVPGFDSFDIVNLRCQSPKMIKIYMLETNDRGDISDD